jgi:hypothetical protein
MFIQRRPGRAVAETLLTVKRLSSARPSPVASFNLSGAPVEAEFCLAQKPGPTDRSFTRLTGET